MTRWLILAVMLAPASVADAQQPAPATVGQGQPAAPTPVQDSPSPVKAPPGYSYNAGGRRDPFVSLLRRGATAATATPVRSAGLAGTASSDISLRGVVAGRDGFLAIVHAADNRTYIARAGQRLLDGTIRSISADAIVIVQRVDDPVATNQPRERELRKTLRQDGNK